MEFKIWNGFCVKYQFIFENWDLIDEEKKKEHVTTSGVSGKHVTNVRWQLHNFQLLVGWRWPEPLLDSIFLPYRFSFLNLKKN